MIRFPNYIFRDDLYGVPLLAFCAIMFDFEKDSFDHIKVDPQLIWCEFSHRRQYMPNLEVKMNKFFDLWNQSFFSEKEN